MALQSITVTLPAFIKPKKVIAIIEGNMKANTEHECQVLLKEEGPEENTFLIWCDNPMAFYTAGMSTAALLQVFSKRFAKSN